MNQKGILLVLAGPSGVGKTTIARKLRERPEFVKITTCTTRGPRPGETDGKNYHFLSREQFEERIRGGALLEYATVHGQLYGTPKDAVLRELDAGRVVVLDIDVQGADAIRKSGLPALLVFLMPPDEQELLRRIRERASESEEQIRVRLETAEREMAQRDSFDAVVVNDDLERAVEGVLGELRRRGTSV